jgi:uncharacterized Zn-binding protein involved in type VI secretion
MTLRAVARVGDSCTLSCQVHGTVSGPFFEGVGNATADGLNIVLVGHRGTASCGHTYRATSGSTIASINGIPLVRVGDPVQFIDVSGTGVVVTGSPVVLSN